MKCHTCEELFDESVCPFCFGEFVTCGCTVNTCIGCRKKFFDNPTKYRFSIALYALRECALFANAELPKREKRRRKRLIFLIKKIAKELGD